jgi:hypothetical protein
MYLRSKKTYHSEFLAPLTVNEITYNFKWIKNGLYYGYPVCCIVEFVQRNTKRKFNATPTRKHIDLLDGNGYIPCDACHCKLASGFSIHKLLRHRKHHQLFPNDTMSLI